MILPQTVAPSNRDASPGATAAGLTLPRPVTWPHEDGKGYLVYQRYRFDKLPGGLVLEIDPCFYFDGFSAPRIAWSLLGLHPMHPRVQATSLIHDAGYGAELFPRDVCDDLLYMTLRMDGLNLARTWACYRAVRFGGAAVWAGHTPESVAEARKYCRLVPAGPPPDEEPFPAWN